jgi:hypothetical protein
VDQDLQGGEAADWARISSKKANLGSLLSQDSVLANQFLPPAQLRFTVTTSHDLSQKALAEAEDSQWSRRILQALLDLLWQLKQVHDLGYASPRKALSTGDFRLGEARVVLHFLAPQAGSLVKKYETKSAARGGSF